MREWAYNKTNRADNSEPSVVQCPFDRVLVLWYLRYVQQSERGIEFEDFKKYLQIMFILKKMSAAQTVTITWQDEYWRTELGMMWDEALLI